MLRREKWEYYTGKARPEVYVEKPFDFKVLKSDIDKYLDSDEELSLLEKRFYRYHCGCSKERILRALRSASREEVFGDKEFISIECPRCAKGIPLNVKEFDEMKKDT